MYPTPSDDSCVWHVRPLSGLARFGLRLWQILWFLVSLALAVGFVWGLIYYGNLLAGGSRQGGGRVLEFIGVLLGGPVLLAVAWWLVRKAERRLAVDLLEKGRNWGEMHLLGIRGVLYNGARAQVRFDGESMILDGSLSRVTKEGGGIGGGSIFSVLLFLIMLPLGRLVWVRGGGDRDGRQTVRTQTPVHAQLRRRHVQSCRCQGGVITLRLTRRLETFGKRITLWIAASHRLAFFVGFDRLFGGLLPEDYRAETKRHLARQRARSPRDPEGIEGFVKALASPRSSTRRVVVRGRGGAFSPGGQAHASSDPNLSLKSSAHAPR